MGELCSLLGVNLGPTMNSVGGTDLEMDPCMCMPEPLHVCKS